MRIRQIRIPVLLNVSPIRLRFVAGQAVPSVTNPEDSQAFPCSKIRGRLPSKGMLGNPGFHMFEQLEASLGARFIIVSAPSQPGLRQSLALATMSRPQSMNVRENKVVSFQPDQIKSSTCEAKTPKAPKPLTRLGN